MNGDQPPGNGSEPLSLQRRVDAACDRFENAWKDGPRPGIEEYLAEVPEPDRIPLFRELLAVEIELRCNGGERPTPEEYQHRFREHSELIRAAFANSPGDADRGPPGSSGGGTTPHTPPTDSSAVDPDSLPPSGSPPVRDHIGRYKVVQWLGGGTYGDVYLAHDAVMDRQVAVKLPSARLLATKRAKEEFLREARSVAQLQHLGIVQAYDFGQEADGRCYIVYEFIDGESLAERIKPERIAADPLRFDEAARIVALVAEALHYAHLQGMFHRDVKPANILLNRQGRAKVTDFGLAVREEELARQRGILAGTLPYMSPEQVLRESHHIDGRTDIYSLGVVLYELLCGRRPFEARTEDELEDQILHREARPLRQIKESIPAELERVCLKALSKRIQDRYTTAKDMAEELCQLAEAVCLPKRPESQVALSHIVRDLEIVAIHVGGWISWRLDVLLRNLSDQPAIIHRITLTVLEDLEDYGYERMARIYPSAKYGIPIGDLEVGQSRSIDVSHCVGPHEVDRFKVALQHTLARLVLRLTLHYNRVQTVEALVGVGVELEPEELRGEDTTNFVTWPDLRAMCGTPVCARCLSRKELLQALQERRIFSHLGPPWVVTEEVQLGDLNEERLQARGGLAPPRRLVVFPRPLPGDIRFRRRNFRIPLSDIVDCDTPAKSQELQANEQLLDAAITGNLDHLQAALAKGADLNVCRQGRPGYRSWWGTVRRENALAMAALNGHLDVVRFLLDQRATLANPCGSYAWFCAAYHGWNAIAKLLEEAGVNLELTGGQWQLIRERQRSAGAPVLRRRARVRVTGWKKAVFVTVVAAAVLAGLLALRFFF
jgi:serine/threonine protein kinase